MPKRDIDQFAFGLIEGRSNRQRDPQQLVSFGAFGRRYGCGSVRTLCDLRSTGEREREPILLSDYPTVSYWARDYYSSFADLRSLLREGIGSGAAARQAMLTGYRELPFHQAPAYRQLFAFLKAGRMPLVFNCSAGKDQ